MALDDTEWITEAVTAAKLNQLSLFSVDTTGSLPATNFSVGAKVMVEDIGTIVQNTGTYSTPSWTTRMVTDTDTGLVAQTETSSGTSTGARQNYALNADTLYIGVKFTMPTTHAFYRISAIEWKANLSTSGTCIAGVLKIDNTPPVDLGIMVVAATGRTTMVSSTTQKIAPNYSQLISGGTELVPFWWSSAANMNLDLDDISSSLITKVGTFPTGEISGSPLPAVVWTANTRRPALKVYHVGYA